MCAEEREKLLDEIVQSVVTFDLDRARDLCKRALDAGVSAYMVMMGGIAKGLDVIGRRYESGEIFLTELIMAGETAKAAFEYLKPHLKADRVKSEGKIVIGTVKGDLHDIGKNIVSAILTSAGFEVHDLGVDVPAEEFVKKAIEVGADIVGMSCLISTTLPYMKEVVSALQKAGIRRRVKIVIGGAPTTQDYAEKIGADRYAKDAMEGLNICKEWMKTKRTADEP